MTIVRVRALRHWANLSFSRIATLNNLCSVVKLTFDQLLISSTCQFGNLSSWANWHLINLSFHQLAILSTYVALSKWHLINLSFNQLAVLPTTPLSHFGNINLLFHKPPIRTILLNVKVKNINKLFHTLDLSKLALILFLDVAHHWK